MALMTNKTTSKKLENRIEEVSEYAMTLYYLFEEGRASLKDLESVFFSKDDEKSSFTYGKILKHMNPSDLKMSLEKYGQSDTNDIKKLNLLYTKKIIDLVLDNTTDQIDKTYINTYNYLLTNLSNK